MLVLTEKLYGIIPAVYPHSCEDGWLLWKNEQGTSCICTNETCPIADSKKFRNALIGMGLKANIGAVSSVEIVTDLHLKSHMEIFEAIMNNNMRSKSKHITKLHTLYLEILNKNETAGFTLAEYMSAWGNSNLGDTRARQIFGREDDLEEFYANYSDPIKMQIHIASLLNISSQCDTVSNITNFLLRNKEDIIRTSKVFRFNKTVKVTKEHQPLNICITGKPIYLKDDNGVYVTFSSREKAIDYLEQKYNIPLIYNDSFKKCTQFLINDQDMAGGKIKKAKASRHCIVTRSDVLEVVLQVLTGDISNVYSNNAITSTTKSPTDSSSTNSTLTTQLPTDSTTTARPPLNITIKGFN